MMRMAAGTVLAAALLSLSPLDLQADALDDAHVAYLSAWEAAPFAVRKALFVAEPAESYGVYVPRDSDIFAADEPLYIYLEPVGYGWVEGDGGFEFGSTVDLRVLDETGAVAFAQEDFLQLRSTSGARVTELFNGVTLNLNGFPPGGYTVELTLKDIASDETAVVALPFTIG